MAKKSDKFIEILFRHLEHGSGETHDEVIHDAIAEYIFVLMGQGNIPQQFLDTIESDLKDEAQELIKKKTYGYSNLKSYRLRK